MRRTRWGKEDDWRRWRARWTVLSLPIAAMALLWGSTTLLSISLLPGLLGGVAQIVLLTNVEAAVSDTYILRAFVATTLFSGLIAVSVAAVGSIAPSAAALSVALLALTSPPCALLRGTHPPGLRLSSTESVADPIPSTAQSYPRAVDATPTAPTMSDVELCHAWRRSFLKLEKARSVGERISLVQLRQSYLDELERRDATALRAWLSAGARAAGGPERHLTRGPHRPDAA